MKFLYISFLHVANMSRLRKMIGISLSVSSHGSGPGEELISEVINMLVDSAFEIVSSYLCDKIKSS